MKSLQSLKNSLILKPLEETASGLYRATAYDKTTRSGVDKKVLYLWQIEEELTRLNKLYLEGYKEGDLG